MKRFFYVLLVLFMAAGLVPATGYAQADSASYVPGEVIIRLWPGIELDNRAMVLGRNSVVTSSDLAGVLRRAGATSAEPLSQGSDTYVVRVNGGDPAAVSARLAGHPLIAFAQPNYIRTIMRVPNDTVLREQWALRNIQAFEAWDITTGTTVPIAVLDTGVYADHPDLRGRVSQGYNAITGSSDANDDNGHGTAVAGLIAAETDNGEGIAGMCWGCVILPVKVLSSRGGGSDLNVARGIRWAADAGARVINLSLGGPNESQVLREAVDYAIARGVLVVAASGNERQEGNPISYPAAYPDVLAVGATGNSDVVTGFSNTGDYIDMTAPGVGLWTTLIDGSYGPPNGTSFSSPYVAGTAGLVWSIRPDLSNRDVACILMASSDDKGPAGKDPEYGYGRLNALRALQLAQGYPGCPLDQPPPPQPQPEPQPDPQPVPQPPAPEPGQPQPPFAPVPPFQSSPERVFFPETSHSLQGEFLRYWQRHGGLQIFGFPISEEFVERGDDGVDYIVQYFERNRFEFHPEQAPPYNVQLGRLGDTVLRLQGRDWFTFPKGSEQPGCLFFNETGHSLCGNFLSFWRSSGLELDGRSGKSVAESLALFGAPLSEPAVEEVAPGVFVTVQWFERARLEDHGPGGIVLGLLGNELTRLKGWR